MRIRWTQAELEDLPRLTWADFHSRYSQRTYDSWEVKRRRINGGTSGTREVLAVSVERSRAAGLVNDILVAVENWALAGDTRVA